VLGGTVKETGSRVSIEARIVDRGPTPTYISWLKVTTLAPGGSESGRYILKPDPVLGSRIYDLFRKADVEKSSPEQLVGRIAHEVREFKPSHAWEKKYVGGSYLDGHGGRLEREELPELDTVIENPSMVLPSYSTERIGNDSRVNAQVTLDPLNGKAFVTVRDLSRSHERPLSMYEVKTNGNRASELDLMLELGLAFEQFWRDGIDGLDEYMRNHPEVAQPLNPPTLADDLHEELEMPEPPAEIAEEVIDRRIVNGEVIEDHNEGISLPSEAEIVLNIGYRKLSVVIRSHPDESATAVRWYAEDPNGFPPGHSLVRRIREMFDKFSNGWEFGINNAIRTLDQLVTQSKCLSPQAPCPRPEEQIPIDLESLLGYQTYCTILDTPGIELGLCWPRNNDEAELRLLCDGARFFLLTFADDRPPQSETLSTENDFRAPQSPHRFSSVRIAMLPNGDLDILAETSLDGELHVYLPADGLATLQGAGAVIRDLSKAMAAQLDERADEITAAENFQNLLENLAEETDGWCTHGNLPDRNNLSGRLAYSHAATFASKYQRRSNLGIKVFMNGSRGEDPNEIQSGEYTAQFRGFGKHSGEVVFDQHGMNKVVINGPVDKLSSEEVSTEWIRVNPPQHPLSNPMMYERFLEFFFSLDRYRDTSRNDSSLRPLKSTYDLDGYRNKLSDYLDLTMLSKESLGPLA
jgi:hypothetical protein